MPIPSIVATLVTAALTLTPAGGGAGAQGPGATRDAAWSTPASAGDPQAGDAASTTQIDVVMEDHTFTPNSIDVRVGDTATFTFFNFGKAVHDAFIGDKAAQDQHEQEMRASPGGPDHADKGAVTVRPGENRPLRYYFDKAGTLEIGCHQPGHYTQFRMIAVLNVHPA